MEAEVIPVANPIDHPQIPEKPIILVGDGAGNLVLVG